MDRAADTRLVGILRRPDGLYAVLSRRSAPFERPAPPKPGDVLPATFAPYSEEVRPLARIPAGLFARQALLLRCWGALAAVERFDADVLANVLVVLLDTVADPATANADVAALVMADPPARPRATAAHPRAFRGTKYKPPKAARPGPIDLRPHLCVVAHEAQLLQRLQPHFDAAARRVERADVIGEVLRAHGLSALRPYGQAWPAECRAQVAAAPPAFRRHWLWTLRGCRAAELRAAIAAHRAVACDHDPSLQCCISRLIAGCPTRDTINWCHVIAALPSARRVHFAELLLESWAYLAAPAPQAMNAMLRADGLCADAVYRHRMYYALNSLKECGDLAYALDGFALANEFHPEQQFHEVAKLHGVAATVQRFVHHARTAEQFFASDALALWELCAQLSGLQAVLDRMDWQGLDPQHAPAVLTLFRKLVDQELPEDVLQQKWQLVRRLAPRLLAEVRAMPAAYHGKALEHLTELLWIWARDVAGLATAVERYLPLLRRICAAPYAASGNLDLVLTDTTFFAPGAWNAVARLPDTVLLKLESAARRKNDAWLMGRGLRTLGWHWGEFAVQALERAPTRLLRALRTLGALPGEQRDSVVDAFRQHPVCTVVEQEASLEQLSALLAEHAACAVTNPFSKRLRAHVLGTRTLGPAQVARDLKLARARWTDVRIDFLAHLVATALTRGLPPGATSDAARHALLLQQDHGLHRRAVRKLLRAHLAGRRDYAATHPRNRAWLVRHPRIDPAAWQTGVQLREEVPSVGVLDLAFESDALEVLRLGTYFGTCLGLGGGLSDFAAAVALDINKRVVYARNAVGRVVARQLLALSEAERLVCFSVYPPSAGPEMRRLFARFDRRLAARLGLARHRPDRDDEYEIATLVAQDFWDDCAWNLDEPPAARRRSAHPGRSSG